VNQGEVEQEGEQVYPVNQQGEVEREGGQVYPVNQEVK